MENASKALIMAGGMLLAILIISLLIYAWSLFSKYQASKDELADIEDTAKFNEQFINYDRKGVQGYELLSLVNKVIDYNYRMSNAEGAKNDEKYQPITIVIDFNGNRKKLLRDSNNQNNKLFTSDLYKQSTTNNVFKDIIGTTHNIESRYGGADCATKIAKGIDGILLTEDQLQQNRNKGVTDEQSWEAAVKKFNSCSENHHVSNKADLQGESNLIYQYYEYMQFKKALFDSQSSAITYENQTGTSENQSGTGRITAMKFVFTGNLY